MKQGKVIFLNGTSSSGKSTTAKLLQQRLDAAFLHVQMDDFFNMVPVQYKDDIEVCGRMLVGFHHSISALVKTNNNVIVDHVLFHDAWLKECAELLRDNYVLFVGVHCPLPELERREKGRADRGEGWAREQYEVIHADKVYDVEIDTFALTPEECVTQIIAFYTSQQPSAFKQLLKPSTAR
jgi:chloramphenicol 3-O phosphotransferase